jgi:Raf kinase inhibitor-like YbhB/YbcL family protein
VHWVAYDIPATINEITEGISIEDIGGKNGTSESGNQGYDGPCPPQNSGPHRYIHHIYALDIPSIGLDTGATKAELLKAIDGHIIGYGQIIGIYEVK